MTPTVASPTLEEQVYGRSAAGWHVGFALFVTLCAATLLAVPDLGDGRRVVAFVLLAVVAGWYPVTGARAMHRPPSSSAGNRYLAVAGPLTLALYGITPVGSVMLFVLFPHIWRMLPTRRAVTATVVSVAAIGGLVLIGNTGPFEERLVTVGWLAGSLVAAVLLGLWITRIGALSEQRAVLLAELEATRTELAAISHDAGVLAERGRLATEIHDTLAQGFTSVLLLVQAIDDELGRDPQRCRAHLRMLEQTARENLAESRAMVAAFTPTHLETATLSAALRRLVARVGRELGVPAEAVIVGSERVLPPGHDVVLLRVTQEALANVRGHAGAGRLDLRLDYGADAVQLEVTDDGCGFRPGEDPDGFGLGGMRRRVEEIGGRLQIRAAPGSGTTVSVQLGIHRPEGDASDVGAGAARR